MARPNKTGLEYFPLDVDFFEDDKIELINSEFGCKGENIAIRLLCKIYKNGYYYKLTEDESLLLAKRVGDGVTGSLVMEVVKGLVRRSFFNEGVFNRFQILTSEGIQRRFFEACSRRAQVKIVPEILLIEVPATLTKVIATETRINAAESTQSKEEKRKVKKTESKVVAPDGAGEFLEIIFPFEGPEFLVNWQHWKSYKQTHFGFKYKSAQSEQAALAELSRLAGGAEQNAIAIIHQSMAKGWKGFFEIKNQKNGHTTKQPTGSEVNTLSAFDKIDSHFGKARTS